MPIPDRSSRHQRHLAGVLLTLTVAGCYWSEKDKQFFDGLYRSFCERIDSVVAAGERDANLLLPAAPDRAYQLLFDYLKVAQEMRKRKLEAALAFLNCEGGKLDAIIKQVFELLDRSLEALPRLQSLLSLAHVVARQYDVDIAGVSSRALGAPETGLRFEFTPQEGIALGQDDGTVISRHGVTGLLVGSLDSRDLESTVTVKRLRLDVSLNLPNESLLAVEDSGAGLLLPLERSDAVHRGGWRGRYSGPLRVTYHSIPGDLEPAGKLEWVHLDFYFDAGFERCSLSTLGPRPVAALFQSPPALELSRRWGLYPDSGHMVADRETRFTVEHGPPGAEIDLYLASDMALAPVLFEGAPWALDPDSQVLVRSGKLDELGHGVIPYVPSPRHSGRFVFFQALARRPDGVASSGLQAARIAVELRRGDANADGAVNISDAVSTFGFLFQGGPAPGCEQAADANASGRIDISDAAFLLNWLFAGGREPPPPGPRLCGVVTQEAGPGSELSCREYKPCGRQ